MTIEEALKDLDLEVGTYHLIVNGLPVTVTVASADQNVPPVRDSESCVDVERGFDPQPQANQGRAVRGKSRKERYRSKYLKLLKARTATRCPRSH